MNTISSAQFWHDVAKELSLDPNQLRSESLEYFGWNEEMLHFLRRAHHKYHLALISNHIEDWLEYLLDKKKLRTLFDTVISSYASGTAKPDKRMYLFAVQQLGISPNECVFIDDMRENLVPAKEMGMKTIKFTSTEQCLEELEKMGISLSDLS